MTVLYQENTPCRPRQLEFSSFHVPQLAGVGDYLENASGVPSPLTPLPINRARGNGKSEGQNIKLDNLTVPLLPMCWEKGKG